MVIPVPPEPVAPFGGIQGTTYHLGSNVSGRLSAKKGGGNQRIAGKGSFTSLRYQVPGQIFFRMADPDSVVAVNPRTGKDRMQTSIKAGLFQDFAACGQVKRC